MKYYEIFNRFYHMNLYFILLFSPRKVLVDGTVCPCEKVSFVDPLRSVKLGKLFLFAFPDYNWALELILQIMYVK